MPPWPTSSHPRAVASDAARAPLTCDRRPEVEQRGALEAPLLIAQGQCSRSGLVHRVGGRPPGARPARGGASQGTAPGHMLASCHLHVQLAQDGLARGDDLAAPDVQRGGGGCLATGTASPDRPGCGPGRGPSARSAWASRSAGALGRKAAWLDRQSAPTHRTYIGSRTLPAPSSREADAILPPAVSRDPLKHRWRPIAGRALFVQ